MSQPFETQPKRSAYPTAAGAMIIVSACQLAVVSLVVSFSYPSRVFLIEWPNLAVSVMLSILAILGGVQALARKRLLFAVFGASILIPQSLSNIAFALNWLVMPVLMFAEDVTMSVSSVLSIAISPVVLVLSVLSLIFLAKSKHEFS